MPGERQPTAVELKQSLTEHLFGQKRMVWVEIPLGSVFANLDKGVGGGTAIADVYSLNKSWTRPDAVIYEVKRTRQDFLRDVNSGKYQRYLPHCNRLVFAIPKGLVQKSEIPPEAGLVVLGDGGWRTVSTGPYRRWTPDHQILFALLMRGHVDFREQRDLADRERWERNASLSDAAHRYGIEIARKIAAADELVTGARQWVRRLGEILDRELLDDDFGQALAELKRTARLTLNEHRQAPLVAEMAGLISAMQGAYAPYPGQLRQLAEHLRNAAAEAERDPR